MINSALLREHPCPLPARPDRRKRSLCIVGAGAFGEFCIPHLSRFFETSVFDARRDLDLICSRHGVRPTDLAAAATADVVLLAVPLSNLREVARAIAPKLRPGTLVVDVCSVKTKPLSILTEELPPGIDIVGTHPLFGPQSGRNGIKGLRVSVCPARGRRSAAVARFLRSKLHLDAIVTTPEEHDRQMAYVQGLTHVMSRIVIAMNLPRFDHTTPTFSHLEKMVDMLRHDSDDLFRTITGDNPYSAEVMASFVRATRDVLQPFLYPSNDDMLA